MAEWILRRPRGAVPPRFAGVRFFALKGPNKPAQGTATIGNASLGDDSD